MKEYDGYKETTLQEKVKRYKKEFGDKALYQAIVEKENDYIYYGTKNYIEIMYYQAGVAKHIRLLGDCYEYGEYIISKINQKYDVHLMYRFDTVYQPLFIVPKGEFICL